ncbi:methyltransferase [Salmonella enterica subsp. houtenae serovar 51:z4,z23:-]|nr:methyltransferase [Salmonella enterica subsp. houtenae serovar 51:z4,z23:-]
MLKQQLIAAGSPRTDDRPLWDAIFGIFGLPALFIAHRLDLFRFVADKNPTFTGICEGLNLHRRGAQILVSTATSLGFLDFIGGRYCLTPLAEDHLLESSPNYFGHYWDLLIDNHEVFSFDALMAAVVNDTPRAYGVDDIYETHREDAERTRTFTRAMHSVSVAAASGWIGKLDLTGHRKMLDIGGGSGAHALTAATVASHLQATVFDLATVCPVTEEFITRYGLEGRVKAQPGDMWNDVFPRADLHFYSHVYHGWTPEKCRFLSQKSFDSMEEGGRIVIHEILYDDAGKTGPFPAAATSMIMLGWGEGEQYSAPQIQFFLEEAGFRDTQVIPTYGYHSIVTGRKP